MVESLEIVKQRFLDIANSAAINDKNLIIKQMISENEQAIITMIDKKISPVEIANKFNDVFIDTYKFKLTAKIIKESFPNKFADKKKRVKK